MNILTSIHDRYSDDSHIGADAHSVSIEARATFRTNTTVIEFCDEFNACRTVWNIVLSCLVTLLASAWLSIRPNISYPADKTRLSVLRCILHKMKIYLSERASLFVLFLVFPEMFLSWAMRQRFVARNLAKEIKSTPAHGFFIIMGGYQFFDGDIPCSPVCRQDVVTLLNQEYIELPMEEEIKDSSKDNAMAKTIVFLQTCWFVIQCLGRIIASTSLTKLEILTLAYISMASWIYITYWDKPRTINRPIPIPDTLLSPSHRFVNRDGRRFLDGPLKRTVNIFFDGYDEYIELSERLSVPTLYSGGVKDHDEDSKAAGTALIFGTVFAAIHCIAWSFYSPSFTERVLWRAASLSIVGFILVFFAGMFVVIVIDPMTKNGTGRTQDTSVLRLLLLFCAVVYVIARIAAFVLAFMALRSLPSGAFQTVPWTNYIPHI